MNCNCCAVHVLTQSLLQNLHVFFKMSPQEAEDIRRRGLDQATDYLQQKRSKQQHYHMIPPLKIRYMQSRSQVESHSLILDGALEHGEVGEQPQDAGLSVRQLPFGGFRPLSSLA